MTTTTRHITLAALALCAPEFHVIGDCVIPATIWETASEWIFGITTPIWLWCPVRITCAAADGR